MGDPFFDLGNFSINHELQPAEDELLLAAYEGDVRPSRLARLTLMRVVSDFREAMWGVLQQGVSSLDVDFVDYAADELRATAPERRHRPLRARPRRGRRGVGSTDADPSDGSRRNGRAHRRTRPDPGERPSAPERVNARDVLLGIFVFAGALILLVGLSSLAREAPVGSSVPSLQASSAAIPSSSVPGGPSASASSIPLGGRALRSVCDDRGRPEPLRSTRGRRHHRRPTPSWSGRGTSRTAIATPTSRQGGSSMASPATCSRPGTTSTRTAPPPSSATATRRRGAASMARTRPAPGNHDWLTPDLAGYRGYFGGSAGPDEVSWYSYDLGAWHIVVLDSDCEAGRRVRSDPAQGRWLAADLAGTHATCTMAIWHHPGSAPASTATTTRWRPSGSCSMTPAPTSWSTDTTTTTSASRHRTRPLDPTRPRASGSSSSARAAPRSGSPGAGRQLGRGVGRRCSASSASCSGRPATTGGSCRRRGRSSNSGSAECHG